MSDRLQIFVQVLPADGAAVPYAQFIEAARQAGANPRDWLKAKHQGLIVAGFNPDGQHIVRRPEQAAN